MESEAPPRRLRVRTFSVCLCTGGTFRVPFRVVTAQPLTIAPMLKPGFGFAGGATGADGLPQEESGVSLYCACSSLTASVRRHSLCLRWVRTAMLKSATKRRQSMQPVAKRFGDKKWLTGFGTMPYHSC
jgi:hypothetical protein